MSVEIDDLQGCDVCGGGHDTEKCPELGFEEDIEQSSEPQISRARLTLPGNLTAFDGDDGTPHVVAGEAIAGKTKFGPLEAPRTTSEFLVENGFLLKVFSKDGTCICLNTTDENACNWLCLVCPAINAEEQNVMAYQNSTDVFYVTMRPISQGEELKVWFAPHYAKKLNKTPAPDGVTTGLLGRQVTSTVLIDGHDNLVAAVDESGDRPMADKPIKFYGRAGHPVMPGTGPYNCQRCGSTFKDPTELARHVREKHVREYVYTGRRPGRPRKIPGQENEKKSQVVTVRTNFQCAICNTFCRSAAALRRHLKLHDKEGKTGCPHCTSEFTDVHQLQEHMKTVHKSNIASKKAITLPKKKKRKSTKDAADNTEKGGGDNNESMNVQGTEDGAEDMDEGELADITSVMKGLSKDALEAEQKLSDESELEEPVSDDEYKPEPYYMREIEPRKPGTRGRPRKVLIEGSFGCVTCGKVYATQLSLANHRCSALQTEDEDSAMSENMDLHECTICEKKFTKQEYLDRHMARHNKEVKSEAAESNEAEDTSNPESVAVEKTAKTEHEFECDLCHIVFSKEKYLYRHMAIHTGDFTCKNCYTSFSRKASLQSHLIKCNPPQLGDDSNKPVFACNRCFRVFGTQLSLDNHMIKHSGKYKCSKCERCYSIKENYDNHKCIIEDPNSMYECSKCPSTFKKHKYLVRHERLHTAQYLCNLCNVTFTRKEELARHSLECFGLRMVERDGKIICQYCSETFTQPDVYRHHIESHTHPFACPKCNKRFIRKTNMENHIPKCNNLSMDGLECQECGKHFRDARYLERHLIVHQEPQYTCEFCTKKFFRRDYLNAHTCKRPDGVVVRTKKRRNNIIAEDPHVCYVCGKSYITKSNLNKHLLVHGEKTFNCDICGKLFYHQHARNLHRNTVHSNELKCQCIECGKMLKTTATLYAHVKQFHTEGNVLYACETCGKQFRQKGNMVKHEMMHSGKRNFSCNYCEKTFKYPEQLRRHELGHTRGKTYVCEHCDRKFVMAFELKKHMKEFHSGVVYVCQFCTEVCRWRHTMRRHIKRKHEQYAALLDDPNYIGTLMKSTDEITQGGRKSLRRTSTTGSKDITIQLPTAMPSPVGLHIQGDNTDIQTVQSFLSDNVVSQEAAEALQSLSAGLAAGQNFTIIQNGQEIMVNVTGQGTEVVESAGTITEDMTAHEDATTMIMDTDDADAVETAMAAISNVVTSNGNVVTDNGDGQISFTDMSQLAGNITSIQNGDGKEQYLLVTWNPPEGQDAQ